MCALTESRGVLSGEHVVPIDGITNIEESKNAAEDKSSLAYLRGLPLKEVVEELLLLGRITCPVAITALLMFSKSMISMLFLGHMGKIELAGGSLAIAFANITGHSVMKGLCMGMEPLCCQAFGAKRWSVLGQTYFKTVLLLLFAAVPVTILWLKVDTLFVLLGQDPQITEVAQSYLFFSIPELLANTHLNPLRSFLRTQGINTPSTIAAICCTILHIPTNYLLVKYWNLGVNGLALASVLFTLNMNVALLLFLFLSKTTIRPWAGLTFTSVFQGWWTLLSFALPSVCSVCLEWWWYEIMLFLSGILSNPQSCVAAVGILIQTTGIIYTFPFALSLSLSQRVGHELGAGDSARAKLAATTGLGVGIAYGLVALGLTIAFRSTYPKLYTDDPLILQLASTAIPLLGLAEVGNSPQTAICGVLTGSARPKLGVHINIAAFYLVGLPAAAIFAFKLNMGFQGLWLGLVAAQAVCSSLMVYTMLQTDWKDQAKRAEVLTLSVVDKDDVELNLIS